MAVGNCCTYSLWSPAYIVPLILLRNTHWSKVTVRLGDSQNKWNICFPARTLNLMASQCFVLQPIRAVCNHYDDYNSDGNASLSSVLCLICLRISTAAIMVLHYIFWGGIILISDLDERFRWTKEFNACEQSPPNQNLNARSRLQRRIMCRLNFFCIKTALTRPYWFRSRLHFLLVVRSIVLFLQPTTAEAVIADLPTETWH